MNDSKPSNLKAATISKIISNEFLELPWHNLNATNGNFLFKYQIKDTTYYLMITDLVHTYYEEIGDSQLWERSAKLNTRFDLDMSGALSQLGSITKRWIANDFKENEELTFVKHDDFTSTLKSMSSLFCLLYHWEFHPVVLESQAVFQHVTQPLLGMTVVHKRCVSTLLDMLKEKVEQIQSYKDHLSILQGESSSSQFNMENFLSKMFQKPDDVFCSSVIDVYRGPVYDAVVLALKNMSSSSSGCIDSSAKDDKSKKIKSSTETFYISNDDKEESENGDNFKESTTQKAPLSPVISPSKKRKKKRFNI